LHSVWSSSSPLCSEYWEILPRRKFYKIWSWPLTSIRTEVKNSWNITYTV
jgi:hypothetical protein